MSITPPKRREYNRKPLKVKMVVKNRRSLGMAYFDSKDISSGGAFLESLDHYEIGTEIELAFSLPGKPKQLKVLGKVVYLVTDEITRDSKLVPGMGIKFLNLKEDDKKLLEAYLEHH
ncbi:MAG: PilZ domain-containing protein [Deltaproteobacteria bacterium]|nr:MAG: PilZ domain-containing protein [Deltaproteobacteria bacterium]